MIFNHIEENIVVLEANEEGSRFLIEDINRSVEKTEKVHKRNVVGKDISEIIPDLEDLELIETVKKVWKTGVPIKIPPFLFHRRHKSRWRESLVLNSMIKISLLFIGMLQEKKEMRNN